MRVNVDLPGGTKVRVTGEPEEIAALIDSTLGTPKRSFDHESPPDAFEALQQAAMDATVDTDPDLPDGGEAADGWRKKIRDRPLQYQVLNLLAIKAGLDCTEISDHLGDETLSAVTSALTDLHKFGWVRREGEGYGSDPFRYFITDAGIETMNTYERQFSEGKKFLPAGYLDDVK